MHAHPMTPVGTVGFDGPRGRTYTHLDVVEIQETHRGAPGKALLERWRRDAGGSFAFVLRVPSVICDPAMARSGAKSPSLPYLPEGVWPEAPFDTTERGQAIWDWLSQSARHLEADAVFLQTGSTFRPTHAHRRQLTSFVERVASPRSFRLIWDNQGLWSESEQLALCRDLDLTPTLDPLVDAIPAGGQAYLRILGRRRSDHGLSADNLHRIAEACTELAWGMVTFHTPRAYRDATSLRSLWAQAYPVDTSS